MGVAVVLWVVLEVLEVRVLRRYEEVEVVVEAAVAVAEAVVVASEKKWKI
jgi:hypothetical protein